MAKLSEFEVGMGAEFWRRLSDQGEALARCAVGNPLLLTFILLAVITRLVFWLYTGRTWEDALMTLTPAINVWNDVGLTHHASEPRVYSFTSVVSMLISLIGEAFGEGLFAVKASSLLASIAAVFYAYRIGQHLKFHPIAQALVLSYLALDHSQIFFGMAGMETQIATAMLLGCVHYYFEKRWSWLGIFVGIGLLCRPEFALFVLLLGAALLIWNRRALLIVVPVSFSIVLPWYLFATIYFGSPIPNTIIAKSWSGRIGFLSLGWTNFLQVMEHLWADVAPFKQFWFTGQTPLPDSVLMVVTAASLALAIVGTVSSGIRHREIGVVFLTIASFVIYRAGIVGNSYYMWYLPPFVALYFLLVGAGVSRLAKRFEVVAMFLALFISVPYAAQNIFMMPLDKRVQEKIEWGIRWKTGTLLNELMNAGDTAVLEPLGYMGLAARNKTIYDFPGLGSKVAVKAISTMRVPSVAGLVNALHPTYAVVRPREMADLTEQYPDVAAKYRPVEHIFVAQSDVNLSFHGMSYYVTDNDFTILQRTAK